MCAASSASSLEDHLGAVMHRGSARGKTGGAGCQAVGFGQVLAAMARSLRIATWNINSLRLRLPLLDHLVRELDPDVICLQETKVPDELFPDAAPGELGYPHVARRGMKGYNGVAILSRLPLA